MRQYEFIVVPMSSVHAILRARMKEPICPVCREPVNLQNGTVDDDGKTAHEDCYVDALIRKVSQIPAIPPKKPSAA